MLAKNKRKEKIESLEAYAIAPSEEKEKEKVFENVVGQDSLTRFDRPKQSKNNRDKKRVTAEGRNARVLNAPNTDQNTDSRNSSKDNNKRRHNKKRPNKNE
jgi:hypothetical protein